MNRSNVGLLDLPNEILYYILHKLDNVDILYSLYNINNQRIDNITRKNIFSNILNFASTTDHGKKLNRFCNVILPKINIKIQE